MNLDNILFVAIALTTFFLFFGIYKAMFEKSVKSQEMIKDLLVEGNRSGPVAVDVRQHQEVVLKKRKKDEKSSLAQLDVKLERANLMVKPQEFMFLSIGCGVVAFLFGLFVFQLGTVLSVVMSLGGVWLPYLFLNFKIWWRIKKADEQFADVLDSLVNCFKTGYGFSRAIQVVSDNYEDPWGTEFRKLSMEMNLGSTQEDALYNLTKRIPTTDVDLFVTALMIQKDTGGNMAELLSNLSKTCRERYKLYRKVAAISAQGKLSAGIVSFIPFLLMGLMYVFLPNAVTDFVTNPIGMIILGIAFVWMCIGIGVLYKMVQIEV